MELLFKRRSIQFTMMSINTTFILSLFLSFLLNLARRQTQAVWVCCAYKAYHTCSLILNLIFFYKYILISSELMLATGSPSSKQLNKYIDAKNLFFKYLKDIHAKLINFQNDTWNLHQTISSMKIRRLLPISQMEDLMNRGDWFFYVHIYTGTIC